MAHLKQPNEFQSWINTLSWPDKLIARCFPRFFKRHAPDEVQKQWALYLEKREKRGK